MRFPRLTAILGAALLAAGAWAAPPDPDQLPSEVRHFRLSAIGGPPVIQLRTTEGKASIRFGARADELITRAVLKVRYSYSPSLIPGQSHIKVILNDEAVGVVPITRENAGKTLNTEVEIDPRLIVDYNSLTLQFIGHYTAECEDPLHSSLWADVSGSSELELTVRPLPLKSDLARLPEPFFDPRDTARLRLPFVFGARPSHQTLRAAAETSSWFGRAAGWRGARFPASLGTIPRGHVVVFATNGERPAALADLPPFKGPALSVMTNPTDGYSRLLLVSGRDAADLKVAADGLARGGAALSGTGMSVTRTEELRPRDAYDAPNWVRMDRPMKFGELVADKQQLQAFGHVPEPLRIDLRIPPDLFTWQSRGVPVDLKFRYTPPIRSSESRLSMSINDELVQSFNLRSSGQGGDTARVVLPLLDGGLLGDAKEVLVPAFKLGTRNQLQYAFSFTYQKEGACKDASVENVRAMLDADSTIDFSGYPHYAEMPHLGYFATAGFPFTKYADLAQTAAVLPEQPDPYDIETLLTLTGRMGESTGYPTTRIEVTSAHDEALLKGRDLLLIGTAARQPLLKRWSDRLPAMIDGSERRIGHPAVAVSSLFDWLGFGTQPRPELATRERMQGSGPLGLMLGFESPLSSGRSVVAVTAVSSQDQLQVLDALERDAVTKTMRGSVVFVAGERVESILAGDTYTIGVLPFWTSIWFPLSSHPILLAVMSVLAVLVFAFALWRSLRALAARRLRGDDR